jgi:uncharacterized protein (TIGR03435 family)
LNTTFLLLEDRFRLRAKRERREMPILELVLARSDRRTGPNPRRCPSSADGSAGLSSTTEPFEIPRGSTSSISGACSPTSSVADAASRQLRAIVVDRTDLDGDWRYRLGFGPDLPEGGATVAPSFTVALREQLGLRLESARGTWTCSSSSQSSNRPRIEPEVSRRMRSDARPARRGLDTSRRRAAGVVMLPGAGIARAA